MKYNSALLCFVVGTIILSFYEMDELFFNHYFGEKINYLLPIGFILLIYGASIMMLQYLKGNKIIEKQNNDDVDHESDELQKLTPINKTSSATQQNNYDELVQRFGQDAARIERDNAIHEAFNRAQQRLRTELAALGRRSNLNLVIGVITTAIAAGLLSYMVLNSPPNFESITSVLSHYLPRFMLVVFIEVFSFFFLRLYRATLAEMRTYQADLTTLTLQEVSVLVALSSGDLGATINLSNNLIGHKAPSDNEKSEKPDKSTDKPESGHQILVDLIDKLIKSSPKKAKEE